MAIAVVGIMVLTGFTVLGQGLLKNMPAPTAAEQPETVEDLAGRFAMNVVQSFTVNLSTGWNLFSLPLTGYGYRASTLGLQPGDMVSQWVPATRVYQNHIVGVPINDFAILPSHGYWINVPSGTRSLTLFGEVPPENQSRAITLPPGGGWALIGFASLRTTWHASDIPAMYNITGSITMVATWNPVTKYYTSWLSVIPSVNNFLIVPGHGYWILAGASGTLSYAPQLDTSPVASFTFTVDGAKVYVDASGSTDDRGIVSYAWDWGDGTTGTGIAASRTYGSGGLSIPTASSGREPPVFPYLVFGYLYLVDGVTRVVGASVTITNMRSGFVFTKVSDEYGYYSVDINAAEGGGCLNGDVVMVNAVKDMLSGIAQGVVDKTVDPFTRLDMIMESSGPVAHDYIVTLTVTDAIGQTSTVQQTVTVYW